MNNKSISDFIIDLKESMSDNRIDMLQLEKSVEELKQYAGKMEKRHKIINLLFCTIGIVLVAIITLLLERVDVMEQRANSLDRAIAIYEHRDSLFVSFMELDSTSVITYRLHEGRPITYRELSTENDSLSIRLRAILNQYPIDVVSIENGVYVKSPQIDSALMLLPIYRDKITYNPQEKCWYVIR